MKEPTLADAMIRETYRSRHSVYDKTNWVRRHIVEARKFVLDANMSAFMADLAYASIESLAPGRRPRAVDGMRELARLPHRVTWIEFDMKARVGRASVYGAGLKSEHSAERGGWLLMQHPQIDTAFMSMDVVSQTTADALDDGSPLIDMPAISPFAATWRTDDGPSPWRMGNSFEHILSISQADGNKWTMAEMLTGIKDYKLDSLVPIHAPWLDGHLDLASVREQRIVATHAVSWLKQFASDTRYLWALLAAINDVPTSYDVVRPSKGYVARGQYRKFLEHTVVRLQVPHKVSLKTLARRVARAARRRAHVVRGHFRRDRFRPGEKLWIAEHQRGDASLGFVTHDYEVKH